ncbi:hypothetical protein QUF80_07030 [Desulfococcaceae bacterium HSG8]|nr:hypothetical protein [Desulfococcaceae bacterium HSG8]
MSLTAGPEVVRKKTGKGRKAAQFSDKHTGEKGKKRKRGHPSEEEVPQSVKKRCPKGCDIRSPLPSETEKKDRKREGKIWLACLCDRSSGKKTLSERCGQM